MDGWTSAAPIGRSRTAEFMASVYRWMAFGLALTGIVAWAVTSSPSLLSVFYQMDEAGNLHSAPAMWVALIAWFLLGVAFNPIAQRAAIGAAVGMFLTFCALSGVVFSSIVFQLACECHSWWLCSSIASGATPLLAIRSRTGP